MFSFSAHANLLQLQGSETRMTCVFSQTLKLWNYISERCVHTISYITTGHACVWVCVCVCVSVCVCLSAVTVMEVTVSYVCAAA